MQHHGLTTASDFGNAALGGKAVKGHSNTRSGQVDLTPLRFVADTCPLVRRLGAYAVAVTSLLTSLGFALGCGSAGHPSSASPQTATIAGWVIYVGGPGGSKPAAERRVNAFVFMRAENGSFETGVISLAHSGFSQVVPPGRYELSAVGNRRPRCPPTIVDAQPVKTVHVDVYTACLVS